MKNLRTARILMGLTLALLIGFQVYWIHKVYSDELSSLKKNTDVIFRETMYKLQVDRFKKDSLLKGLPGENLFVMDMVNILKKRIEDSSIGGSRKNIIISFDNRVDTDRSRVFTPPVFPGKHDTIIHENIIVKGSGHPPGFLESLNDKSRIYDSIPIKIIDSAYAADLSASKLKIHFLLTKILLQKDTIPCTESFCTGNVPMGLFGLVGYRAGFENPLAYIVRSISTQILLSILLIGLTITSFIFIYRNLVNQKRLSDIKNEFISNITHELKTPISTVSVAIEAMKNFNALQNPERTAEYLDIAGNELQRLSMLVDKVLKLSMFEQSQIELKYEWFDLEELINEVLRSMKLQFEKKQATLKFRIKGDDLNIQADRVHIAAVLYNLLDNALKYSNNNPAININLVRNPDHFLLSVEDNGRGIPSAYTMKIFEKFFRVPHGDEHKIKGYGLGLSYVMHIVQRHKGSVKVESTINQGSIFTIKLPIKHE